MYEIGTQVRYHGSMEPLHGEIFTVVEHCCSGTRHRIDGSRLLHHVRLGSITPVDHADPFAELERAASDTQLVMITYVAADGEWTTRTIEPFALVETNAGHQIIRAMDHRSGEVRSFRVDRIRDLTFLPGSFRLDRPALDRAREESAALARIRAEIALVGDHHYVDAAHWTPTP